MDVDDYNIDASVGLVFSLELFKLHKLSGHMTAELHRASGIFKHGIAHMEITDGLVTSCFVMDKKGQRHSVNKETLIQLDQEKGPFEWSFHQSKPVQQSRRTGYLDVRIQPPPYSIRPSFPPAGPSPSSSFDVLIPKIIAPIDWHRLRNWTDRQRQELHMVCQLIDGRRTIRDIKIALLASHSSTLVDEALRVLLHSQVIVLFK